MENPGDIVSDFVALVNWIVCYRYPLGLGVWFKSFREINISNVRIRYFRIGNLCVTFSYVFDGEFFATFERSRGRFGAITADRLSLPELGCYFWVKKYFCDLHTAGCHKTIICVVKEILTIITLGWLFCRPIISIWIRIWCTALILKILNEFSFFGRALLSFLLTICATLLILKPSSWSAIWMSFVLKRVGRLLIIPLITEACMGLLYNVSVI